MNRLKEQFNLKSVEEANRFTEKESKELDIIWEDILSDFEKLKDAFDWKEI